MSRLLLLACTAASLTLACTGGDGDDEAGDGSSDATADDTAGPSIDVPTDATALADWLNAETYAGWPAEAAIHDATGNSPHGRVRTFFNDVLADSFTAGNSTHTVGSASVKELYDAMDMRIGWAVGVKVAEGEAADSWYWYLESGGSVNADGNGVALCDGCHSAGVDRIVTAYPFE